MVFEQRIPEGRELETDTLGVFAKVSAWTGKAAAWRVNRILRLDPDAPLRLLDIGTGPGAIPLHFKAFRPKVTLTGLDVALPMLTKAQNLANRLDRHAFFIQAEGERMPFADASFDVVTSFYAMHHMDDPGAMLAEVDRVLTPGGVFLLIDFRRDMARARFRAMNALWKTAFLLSPGRNGLEESVRSAWTTDEIRGILGTRSIRRFTIRAGGSELWITAGLQG
ncbi:hypothetical protein DPQ33_02315 [Oceanidesulfovibrio indonesiensis]|uniref:Methyltransferase type 11 domain-containing protein n=1 Tax=Oceanidesulfovibrio indonesiensis TaxID=54767 RepID=A0A7M3MIK4_9BACT|nr:class I SAM-dependent methyltransferase [Oceanidesulfovibrio indonesiensis]TVM19215.1 hypothetical protein DPQ33_02315 [Oceanidesulfovibrio indonesiensis]